ncbi:MAG: hypothetical protein HY692_08865, partial [Cyanobacteria bacterium NC_groundwater_1444_Ag_S-0.65um_54_12]|nr:hypothetical protein [Cyanobacteria bacterium NC_groundwater_1444_Ag_S-0.65um_54_12]
MVSRFGWVIIGSLVLTSGCSSEEINLPVTSLYTVSALHHGQLGPAGKLVVNLELPVNRKTQALPEGTEKVSITVTSSRLAAPVQKTINKSQFIDNKALLLVEKLPVGEAKVSAVVYDAADKQITMGDAVAMIQA